MIPCNYRQWLGRNNTSNAIRVIIAKCNIILTMIKSNG